MSKRKDRERFAALRANNPNYHGFRGYGDDSNRPSPEALTGVTCTVCGRRRNVTQEVAQQEGDGYVCLSCREQQGEAAEEGEGAQEAVTAP